MQLPDQLVEARGQDDDVPRRPGSGVAECMRHARRHENGGTRADNNLVVREPETQRSGHHMPRLVIGVMDVKRRDLARKPVGRPVLDHQVRAADGKAGCVTFLR
ncbi:MAG TPA: hypothetical protein VMF87_17060 [Streptosporangiaceae bacterium]|nr:hypothetical protein [Streptosporangiaceae bacterium]